MEKVGNVWLRKDLLSGLEYVSYEYFKDGKFAVYFKVERIKEKIQCEITRDPNRFVEELMKKLTPYLEDGEERLKMLEEEIVVIRSELDEIYNAPGMPGYVEAKNDFSLRVLRDP